MQPSWPPKNSILRLVFVYLGWRSQLALGERIPGVRLSLATWVSNHAHVMHWPRFPPFDCSALWFITEPLAERRLLDVRLGELPTWLATRDFSPRGLLGGVQKGEAELPAELSPFPD